MEAQNKFLIPVSDLAVTPLLTGEPNVAPPPKVGLLPKSVEPPNVAAPPNAGCDCPNPPKLGGDVLPNEGAGAAAVCCTPKEDGDVTPNAP